MTSIRPAAVAGAFYPAGLKELDATVQFHLSRVERAVSPIPKVIIEDKGKRSLFLPSVYEALPWPDAFLHHLKLKAGFSAEHWSETFQASRFVAEEMAAADLDDPAALWDQSHQKRVTP
jgi:hypothetical protein